MVKFVDFLVNKNGFCLFENYPSIQTPYNYTSGRGNSRGAPTLSTLIGYRAKIYNIQRIYGWLAQATN